MTAKNGWLIALGMIAFNFAITAPVFKYADVNVWMANFVFLVASVVWVMYNIVGRRIEENIIPLFASLYYFIYMTMNQLYLLYARAYTSAEFVQVMYVVILSVPLLMLGNAIGWKLKMKPFNFALRQPTELAYFVLLALALTAVYIQLAAAGGVEAFFTAKYQEKYDSVETSKMMGGISRLPSLFSFYNMMYLFDRRKRLRWSSRTYFVINLIMIFGRGKSLAILYQLVGLCLIQVFGNSNRRQLRLSQRQKRWLQRAGVMLAVGIVAAVLVRFNRSSDEFSFGVLADTYTLLISTSTFDALYNYDCIVRGLSPLMGLGQFVFPFIFWIPRSIMTSKPEDLQRIAAVEFHGFNANQHGGYSVTPMAEFYYDMGYIGIVCGMVFLGALIVILQKKLDLLSSTNRKYRWSVAMCIMFGTVSLPVGWGSMGSRLVALFFFMCIESVLKKISLKRS